MYLWIYGKPSLDYFHPEENLKNVQNLRQEASFYIISMQIYATLPLNIKEIRDYMHPV